MANYPAAQKSADELESRTILPSFWQRALVNGLIWGLLFGYLFFILPQLFPIYQKLDEKDALPELNRTMWALVRFIEDSFYLPVVFSAICFIAIDQYIVARISNGKLPKIYYLIWAIGCRSLALLAFVLAIKATFLTVY